MKSEVVWEDGVGNKIAQGPSLHIPELEWEDMGGYSCTYRTAAGTTIQNIPRQQVVQSNRYEGEKISKMLHKMYK